MKDHLLDAVIVINLAGLSIITGFESWRPGLISAGINIGLVWLMATILISFCFLIKRRGISTE